MHSHQYTNSRWSGPYTANLYMCSNRGIICLNDQEYVLSDSNFPTIDPADPYALSEREQSLMDRLKFSFQHSGKLQAHTRFLYAKGSLYLVHDQHLLYHGCIPLNEQHQFAEFVVDGRSYKARDFMDRTERLARQGFFATDPAMRQYGQDAMWYLWCGPKSPLFGKDKMATFERYFCEDKERS